MAQGGEPDGLDEGLGAALSPTMSGQRTWSSITEGRITLASLSPWNEREAAPLAGMEKARPARRSAPRRRSMDFRSVEATTIMEAARLLKGAAAALAGAGALA